MKKAKLEVRPYRHHPKYKWVLNLRPFGKGRKFFRTRGEAEAEQFRQKVALEKHGREAMGLPAHELYDFIEGRKTLAEYGKTVNDAIEFFVDHLERIRRCKVAIAELASEVIEAKRKDGRAPVYIADLSMRLRRFCQDFGDRPIAGITVEEIDHWLRALPYSPKSRDNYRRNIGVLFGYAVRRRMLDFNPVAHTERPKLPDNPPEIFAVDELRALLDAATKKAPDIIPMLTIGAFVGLRAAEIERLDWSEVYLVRGHIEVKAAKAKSARRRIVPMQPNLASWLRPYAAMKGSVVPKGAKGKLARVRAVAGIARWPNNGLRHSFASYRLAAIHDAPRVASELGHTSPMMLYNTYREVVRPDEAERYWKVAPASETANVVAFNRN